MWVGGRRQEGATTVFFSPHSMSLNNPNILIALFSQFSCNLIEDFGNAQLLAHQGFLFFLRKALWLNESHIQKEYIYIFNLYCRTILKHESNTLPTPFSSPASPSAM